MDEETRKKLLDMAKELKPGPQVETISNEEIIGEIRKPRDNRFVFKSAFPSNDADTWKGLSKREFFISQAVAGLSSSSGQSCHPEVIARRAVDIGNATFDLLTEELENHRKSRVKK